MGFWQESWHNFYWCFTLAIDQFLIQSKKFIECFSHTPKKLLTNSQFNLKQIFLIEICLGAWSIDPLDLIFVKVILSVAHRDLIMPFYWKTKFNHNSSPRASGYKMLLIFPMLIWKYFHLNMAKKAWSLRFFYFTFGHEMSIKLFSTSDQRPCL